MKRFAFLAVTICVASVISLGGHAWSQQPDSHADHNHEGHNHAEHDHSSEILAYSLPEWKTMHFDDAAKAKQHSEMVAKLGCEVKQGSHSGHIDLSYRCQQWKSLQVASHKLAEQWIGWLKSSGFDLSHGHVDPRYAQGQETVEFRLVTWKSTHGDGGANDKQLAETLQSLGVEVVSENHGKHNDIRYRSPVWRDVHVADHAAADQLSTWLKQVGFEVAAHKH